MQTVLNKKGVGINSEDLQNIAKEFGKVADRVGLRSHNVYMSPSKEGNKQSIYMVAEGFLFEKNLDTEGDTITAAIPVGEFRININALPNKEEINLKVLKNSLSLAWGEKGSELLVNMSDDVIATYEVPEVVQWIEWKPGTLHEIYRSMSGFVASTTDTIAQSKPILTGVYFQRDNDFEETYLKATDSRKAASISQKIDWFNTPFSVPQATLSALCEVFSSDSHIQVGINENATLLVFKDASTTMVTRVLSDSGENRFPDIDKNYTLSPTNAETAYHLDLQNVIEACHMVLKLSPTSRTMQIRIHENKVYAFTGWDAQSKQFKLKCFLGGSVDGKEEPIALDAANLLAAAKLFDGDEISLLTPRKNGPVTVLNEDTEFTQALIGQILI